MRTLKGLHEKTAYKIKGAREYSSSWTPVRGLREGCATSPVLFNIYHACAMRGAKTQRDKEAGRRETEAGIRWQWIPGNSLPPRDVNKARDNSHAETIVIQESLFADDTTLIGYEQEILEGKEVVKRSMLEFEEKCHDGKEEVLRFGEPESRGIRMLGTRVGRKEDVDSRIQRANKAWFVVKKRLKHSRLTKRVQARVISACIESIITFDAASRPWFVSEYQRMQRVVDKMYRYVWMDKKGGPALRQMAAAGINMFGIRRELQATSIRSQIEQRVLLRIGHVLRMDNSRLTKVAVLG